MSFELEGNFGEIPWKDGEIFPINLCEDLGEIFTEAILVARYHMHEYNVC